MGDPRVFLRKDAGVPSERGLRETRAGSSQEELWTPRWPKEVGMNLMLLRKKLCYGSLQEGERTLGSSLGKVDTSRITLRKKG